ncbi:hypothetical protein [Pseudonocardia sp. ICBG601]|uniref:hypothetical protein n=1 Tax=Pseudonocardia sp. ICBG601 TaxID=2846759 RepID=UPI0021F6358E|nr:hypothetical protein [Pseudonocardia sp. ICBG601]
MQRHDIAVTVLERETDIATRDQGGTLDMQRDSGQIALDAAGLLEEFLRISRPEGQDMRMLALDGTVLLDERAAPGETFNPEIDRGDLRTLLLGSLGPARCAGAPGSTTSNTATTDDSTRTRRGAGQDHRGPRVGRTGHVPGSARCCRTRRRRTGSRSSSCGSRRRRSPGSTTWSAAAP